MATADAGEGSPWPEYVDSAHLTGDYYFIRGKYPRTYWWVAGILSLFAPPAGVGLLAFFLMSSVHTPDDEIAMEMAE